MFSFNKKDKEEVEKEYEKLLKSVGKDKKNEGFVLGEKKEIYEKDMSLDDILSKMN